MYYDKTSRTNIRTVSKPSRMKDVTSKVKHYPSESRTVTVLDCKGQFLIFGLTSFVLEGLDTVLLLVLEVLFVKFC